MRPKPLDLRRKEERWNEADLSLFPSLVSFVDSLDAPAAIGPYVQSVKYGGLAYLSGCIPLDPKSVSLNPTEKEREGRKEEEKEMAVPPLPPSFFNSLENSTQTDPLVRSFECL